MSVDPAAHSAPGRGTDRARRWLAEVLPGPAVGRSWLLEIELSWYLLVLTIVVVGRAAGHRPETTLEYWVMAVLAALCALLALARWWSPRWTGPALMIVLALGIVVLVARPIGPLGPLRLMLSVAIVPVLLVATARRSGWWTLGAAILLAGAEVALDASLGGNTLSADLTQWLVAGAPTRQFVRVTGALLVVAPVAAGLLLRSGDAGRRAEAQARRAEALARVRAEERLQVARELHDMVANHVTGIIVSAQVAGLSSSLPATTTRALDDIEAAGNRALAAMRRMVGALRSRDDLAGPGTAAPADRAEVLPAADSTALAAVRAALESSGAGGGTASGDVAVTVSGDAEAPVAADVVVTVHRIVVEALTNARRHTPPGVPISVALSTPPGGVLVLEVVNALVPGAGIRGGGYGLVGLRERAAAVGGRLDAGPVAGGRWCLRAVLPMG